MSALDNVRRKAKDVIFSEDDKGVFPISGNESFAAFVTKSLINRFFTDNVGGSAAQLAYYLIFSFAPFLIFLNAVLAYIEVPVETVLSALSKIIPAEAVDIVAVYLEHIYSHRTLGFLFFGLVLGLYSISRAVKSLLYALSRAYRSKRQGGILHTFVAVGFTFVVFAGLVILLGLMTMSKELLGLLWVRIGFSYYLLELWNVLRWLFILLIAFLIILGVYTIVPYNRIRVIHALPGTVFATVVWIIASALFSFYVDNFARYSVVYGSLGAIIILLLWLYLSGVVLIMGGELNNILITYRKRK